LERRRRVIVRRLQFHRLEASRGGRAEALEQRPLGEQIGQVGGKARHYFHPPRRFCCSKVTVLRHEGKRDFRRILMQVTEFYRVFASRPVPFCRTLPTK